MTAKQNVLSISKKATVVLENKLFLVFAFAFLTAIGAQIAVPIKPVPFTLQAMMVVLAGAFLGAKYGFYSQLVYLAMGAVGLPVFAQVPDAAIGIARIFGPTGGYLLAFPLAAFTAGYFIQTNKSYLNVVLSMFLGHALIITIGTFYLNIFFISDFTKAIAAGAALFSLWTAIKVFAGAAIFTSINKLKEKNNS